MTTYRPSGFGVTSSIGPHQGLRITFAETRSLFTPDVVEAADLRDNLDHLVQKMADGGFSLAPASGVTVAPGELAATVDFAKVTPGYLSVADAITQIEGALYGPLDLVRRTYIRDVVLMGEGGTGWGAPITPPTADSEASVGGIFAGTLGVGLLVAAVAAAFVYAPEIKGALRAKR